MNLKIGEHSATQYQPNGTVYQNHMSSNSAQIQPEQHIPSIHPPMPVQSSTEPEINNLGNSVATQLCNDYAQATTSSHLSQPNYEYLSVIQPPGSPDDDDYRHNYQDVLMDCCRPSTIGNVSNIVGSITIHNNPVVESQQELNNGHHHSQSSYTQTNNEESTTHLENNGAVIEATQIAQGDTNNNSNELDTNGETVDESNFNQTGVGECLQQTFSALHGIHYDPCASPFQSPTSTPHPMMIPNYMNQELQSCCSNECVRYP